MRKIFDSLKKILTPPFSSKTLNKFRKILQRLDQRLKVLALTHEAKRKEWIHLSETFVEMGKQCVEFEKRLKKIIDKAQEMKPQDPWCYWHWRLNLLNILFLKALYEYEISLTHKKMWSVLDQRLKISQSEWSGKNDLQVRQQVEQWKTDILNLLERQQRMKSQLQSYHSSAASEHIVLSILKAIESVVQVEEKALHETTQKCSSQWSIVKDLSWPLEKTWLYVHSLRSQHYVISKDLRAAEKMLLNLDRQFQMLKEKISQQPPVQSVLSDIERLNGYIEKIKSTSLFQ